MNRKTTPKVKEGRVQKKNRHALTPNYWNTRQTTLKIDIENPGKGYKHFLKMRDIIKFLELLPHWEEIEIEFDAILLAQGGGPDGWYNNGVIGICAWDKNMTCSFGKDYFNAHKNLFERLGVKYEIKKDGVVCFFDENQRQTLEAIALLTPYIGGDAVYSARVMLGINPNNYNLAYRQEKPTNNSIATTLENNALVYPSPAKDVLTIEFDKKIEKTSTFILTDIAGRKIQEFELVQGKSKFTLDVSLLNNGIYFYNLSTDSRIKGKVIINN